jgi:hypothetical protein
MLGCWGPRILKGGNRVFRVEHDCMPQTGKRTLPNRVVTTLPNHTMFQFVTIAHPDDIKDRKKQGKLRQHAIRNGIQRSKSDRAKKDGIFVSVEIDEKTGQPMRRTPRVGSITNTPSISLLDPFDTLCGCPERLRTLMRHRTYLPYHVQTKGI